MTTGLLYLGLGTQLRAQASTDMLQRAIVHADGHPLHVWFKRPPNPRGTILLVHGRTWSSLPNFDLHVGRRSVSVMDRFVGRGYAVYALDMRGYGATPRDASGWLTPTRAASDVAAVLAWIGQKEPRLSKPVLVGYSRGAVVSLLVAQLYPATLSALVLYGMGYDAGAKLQPPLEPMQPPRQPTTAAAAASDFITPTATPPDVVRAYVERALLSDPVRADWRREQEFWAIDPLQVATPTLLLHGARDNYVRMDAQGRLFSTLATERKAWVVLPGVDHAAHVETAQAQWIDAILDFVEPH